MTNDPFAEIQPETKPRPKPNDDRLDKVEVMLGRVVDWISSQSQSQQPVPKVEPTRRQRYVRQSRPSTPPAWSIVQTLLIFILGGIILWQVFAKSQPDAQAEADAYQRAVASVHTVSAKMAEGLYALSAEIESGTVADKQAVGQRLKSVIKDALDAASEAQLTALDSIEPWDPKAAGKRIVWAADGYSDTAGRIK